LVFQNFLFDLSTPALLIKHSDSSAFSCVSYVIYHNKLWTCELPLTVFLTLGT